MRPLIGGEGLTRLMGGDPFLEFGDMTGLLLHELLRQRFDFGIGRRFKHVPVIYMARRVRPIRI